MIEIIYYKNKLFICFFFIINYYIMYTFVLVLILILIVIYILDRVYLEPFESNEPMELLVFVSNSCGHCVNYNNNFHDGVMALAKSQGVSVKRIFADKDPDNLFKKFNIMYVPSAILMKGNKIYKNLGNNVNPQSIKEAISN